MTTENKVETELKKVVKDMGGLCYKFVSPGRKNVPDRICVLPHGVVFFIECKSTGKKLRGGQRREVIRLRDLGQNAYELDSMRQLAALKLIMITEVEYARVWNEKR